MISSVWGNPSREAVRAELVELINDMNVPYPASYVQENDVHNFECKVRTQGLKLDALKELWKMLDPAAPDTTREDLLAEAELAERTRAGLARLPDPDD